VTVPERLITARNRRLRVSRSTGTSEAQPTMVSP
jgi:hypothetical protein